MITRTLERWVVKILLFLFCLIQGYSAFNLTWGIPAVNLDSNPPAGDTDGNATIAIDLMGNAVATWSRTKGLAATEDIWAAAYNHSLRVWTGAILISGGSSAAHSRVAMDSNGNSLFLWDEGFPTQIMYRTLSSTGVWAPPLSEPPMKVSPSKNSQTSPHIRLDENGNALAIWMEFFNGKDHIFSAKKMKGIDWTSLGEVSSGKNTTFISSNKPIAVNRSGDAIAVWEEMNGNTVEVHGANFTNGAWMSPMTISAQTGKSSRFPSVGIDLAGNGVITWDQNKAIQSKTLLNGTLSENTLLISHPAYIAQHPDLCVDDMGNAVIVFERYNSMHKFISSATLAFNGNAWTSPIDISGPSSADAITAGYPVLSLNGIGDGVAIWKEFNGENTIVQGAGYALGTWSMIKTLSSRENNSGAPVPAYDMAVAVNLAGNILAVWPEDSSETGSLQIKATAGVGLANIAPLPPIVDPLTIFSGIASGNQVLHRFPAHSDLINLLTWTSPGGVDHYKIYRGNLSNLIGTSKLPEFEDHQRVPKKQETYLITSVDVHMQESSPITLVVQPN